MKIIWSKRSWEKKMPVKSPKQFRAMSVAAASEGKSKFGPSKQVAQEFLSKTPKKKKMLFASKSMK